jgi:hypothetical protein
VFNLAPNSFSTFTLPSGWANLRSVTFTGINSPHPGPGMTQFSLDDIIVQ